MRRTATVVASVVVGVVLCVACLPPPSGWYGDSGPRVGVIGDSLVQAAEAGGFQTNDPDRFLSAAMAEAGYRTSTSAFVGATTSDLGVLLSFPEPGPEISVLALGTNDMRDGRVAVETALGNIVGYLERRPVACTALVTIVDEPTWGLDVTAPLYNLALAALAGARDDVVVVDWGAVVDEHPEYLAPDGVHHTAEGQEAYRSLLVSAAGECARFLAPDPG